MVEVKCVNKTFGEVRLGFSGTKDNWNRGHIEMGAGNLS